MTRRLSAPRPLALSGELTVQTAAATKEALVRHLAEDKDLALDLSGVSEIDTAGLQLLLLARREAATRAVGFSLSAVSAPVRDVLGLARLGDDLDGLSSAGATGATES